MKGGQVARETLDQRTSVFKEEFTVATRLQHTWLFFGTPFPGKGSGRV